ncbi:hypothetical protein J7T55_005872 [Diaporthe amygdali]|uniref:uncharacterized protein n=1 Tax=Phomopsis amygdali TaxID=1214568 RepID=UPI0022FE2FA8|nr:uncharacterized protein J7T55_005872 [Diaporthe amygdali]KAJ0124534.1 hypothetical protein J7T55_005872 [Diaporthe amygdali]
MQDKHFRVAPVLVASRDIQKIRGELSESIDVFQKMGRGGWLMLWMDFFRPLPSLTSFTALRTLFLSQGTIRFFQPPDEVTPMDSLIRLLPKSIEKLSIKDFSEDSRATVLELAKQTRAGEFPNLRQVRLIGNEIPSMMTGSSFLFLANEEQGEDSGNEYITSVIHMSDEGVDCSQTLNEEDHELSGDDISDWALYEEDMSFDQHWVDVFDRCQSDHAFLFSIVRHVQRHSEVVLYAALTSATLRRKVRKLFAEANVKFECVGVGSAELWDSDRGKLSIAYM